MPRNVRNFWLKATIDGRSAKLEGGPQAKEGGLYLTVEQRDAGRIITALKVSGIARRDGTLLLRIEPTRAGGAHLSVTEDGGAFEIETNRDAEKGGRK